MDGPIPWPRLLFAVALAGFAGQHLLHATRMGGPVPGPPWLPGPAIWSYLAAAVLLLASIGIAIQKWTRVASVLAGATLFVYFVLHVPGVVSEPRDAGNWVSSSELLALAGAAWVLAGADRVERFLFAPPLLVFGILHFIYAAGVAALVPAWIPVPLFWAYFVGVAFVAAGLSIATGILARLAATLLGVMFALLVLLVHIPRVVGAPDNGKEWTSALVALAMCGGAFIIAGARRSHARDTARATKGRHGIAGGKNWTDVALNCSGTSVVPCVPSWNRAAEHELGAKIRGPRDPHTVDFRIRRGPAPRAAQMGRHIVDFRIRRGQAPRARWA